MRQRIRHDGCARAPGGYLEHDVDWLGRMVERCDGCGMQQLILAIRVARKGQTKTPSAIKARREAAYLAVPIGRQQAATLRELLAITGYAEMTLRQYLQTLMSGRRVKMAMVRRPGHVSKQPTSIYWRDAEETSA